MNSTARCLADITFKGVYDTSVEQCEANLELGLFYTTIGLSAVVTVIAGWALYVNTRKAREQIKGRTCLAAVLDVLHIRACRLCVMIMVLALLRLVRYAWLVADVRTHSAQFTTGETWVLNILFYVPYPLFVNAFAELLLSWRFALSTVHTAAQNTWERYQIWIIVALNWVLTLVVILVQSVRGASLLAVQQALCGLGLLYLSIKNWVDGRRVLQLLLHSHRMIASNSASSGGASAADAAALHRQTHLTALVTRITSLTVAGLALMLAMAIAAPLDTSHHFFVVRSFVFRFLEAGFVLAVMSVFVPSWRASATKTPSGQRHTPLPAPLPPSRGDTKSGAAMAAAGAGADTMAANARRGADGDADATHASVNPAHESDDVLLNSSEVSLVPLDIIDAAGVGVSAGAGVHEVSKASPSTGSADSPSSRSASFEPAPAVDDRPHNRAADGVASVQAQSQPHHVVSSSTSFAPAVFSLALPVTASQNSSTSGHSRGTHAAGKPEARVAHDIEPEESAVSQSQSIVLLH